MISTAVWVLALAPAESDMDGGGCAVGRAPARGPRGVSGPLPLVVLLLCVARRRHPR